MYNVACKEKLRVYSGMLIDFALVTNDTLKISALNQAVKIYDISKVYPSFNLIAKFLRNMK